MQTRQDRGHTNSLVAAAKNIAIVSGRQGTDGVAAAIAISEYIKDKFNKTPVVIYPFDSGEFNNELLMIENVIDGLEPVSLKISLNYEGTNIESVDYRKEDDSKLILEIKPVERDFDMERIKYELNGTTYDLVITIGAKNLSDLGDFYTKNKGELEKASVINIDNSINNENFGKLNIVSPEAANLSTLVLTKFGEWGYTTSKAAAKSLLIGLNG